MIQRVLTDHGTQFTSVKWKSTLASLNVAVSFSSVIHPESNPSEKIMRDLDRLCRTYCLEHSKWAQGLPKFAEFLNNVLHESIGFSPNELHYSIIASSSYQNQYKLAVNLLIKIRRQN